MRYLRYLFVVVASVAATLFVMAQTPAKPDPASIKLIGNRFPPLQYATMTPEQKLMVQHILAGDRVSLGGPFNVLLRSPEMGDLASQMGGIMRFHSSIPKKLNEMAIILTARNWSSPYEWNAHRNAAAMAGLAEAKIKAIAANKKPEGMDADEQIVYTFCNEMLQTHQLSDATFNTTKARFGERGMVDLIGVMGWYQMVSMALNADRYPLPDGVKPELAPVR